MATVAATGNYQQPTHYEESHEAEAMWHVEVEPGEVKVMSLERLDDLYRLEVISPSTKVWQPGMSEWLPLAVVAGLEDELEEVDAVLEVDDEPLPSFDSPSSAQPPPWANADDSSVFPAALPAPSTSTFPSHLPAHEPIQASDPVAPTAQAQPMSVLPGASIAPNTVASAAPQTFANSVSPSIGSSFEEVAPRSGNRIEIFVLSLACVSALLVTLYRNDLLANLAQATDQADSYQKLEMMIGKPGFGTTRSLDDLRKLAAPIQATFEPANPAEPGDANRTSPPKRDEASATGTPQTDSAPSETEAAETADEEIKGGEPAKKQVSAPSKPRRAIKPKAVTRPRSGTPVPESNTKTGLKGSSNEYDPLNPTL